MKHSVDVPEGFVADLRVAILQEIRTDANPDRYDPEDAEIIARQVREDTELYEQLATVGEVEAVTVRGSAEAMASAFEQMARNVTAKLSAALDFTPIDTDGAAGAYELVETLGWALDQAVESHRTYARGRGLAAVR